MRTSGTWEIGGFIHPKSQNDPNQELLFSNGRSQETAATPA